MSLTAEDFYRLGKAYRATMFDFAVHEITITGTEGGYVQGIEDGRVVWHHCSYLHPTRRGAAAECRDAARRSAPILRRQLAGAERAMADPIDDEPTQVMDVPVVVTEDHEIGG